MAPTPIMQANDAVAARIRERLTKARVVAVNVVGTPGAGKTALLEATLSRIEGRFRAGVVVGDLATDNDARRLARPSVPVIPIETGTGCHLTAPMIEKALTRLPVEGLDLLFVENVGNLVCPALFDVGEDVKVALVSVTEGTDKPEKYPVIIQNAALLLFTKVDLLPHVDFDMARASELARRIHPEIEILPLSSRTGEGMDAWIEWLAHRHGAIRKGEGRS